MSSEDQELLAKIGQLAGKNQAATNFSANAPLTMTAAGKINRHKSRQSGAPSTPNHHPAHHRGMLHEPRLKR
jgi:hypothetical protein